MRCLRFLLPLALAGLTPLPAAAAGSGTIFGRVEVDAPPPGAARRPSVSGLGMPAARELPERRRSVVYLEVAPRAAFEDRPAARATLDQRNETFVPRVLAIMAGDEVDFPNSDPTYHNVFSLSEAKTFDLGRYAAGRSRSVHFDRPGIVRVFCDIHSHMSAFILVFSHPYFAVTDEEGRYRIDGVPPGTYTVAVWSEAVSGAPQPVVVNEGGRVELNFALARR